VRRSLLIALVAALCASGPAAAATGRVSGDPLQSQEWWLHDVGADQATPPGPGVPITIVDSGVDATSPEFANRPNTTFLNSQSVDGPEEWHGTAVASVAAAPENGVDIVGVYPQAALQVWDASPTSTISTFSAISGIEAAAQHCPGVINLSFGSTQPSTQLQAAILDAFHNGCLVVASAGNDGANGHPNFPAAYAHVLTVAANDQNDTVPAFSSEGPWVDLAAPGVGLIGAVPLSHDPNGYSGGLDGTSFSAPIVSAAAAWVWTMRPTLDVTQIFELMRRSARDIGPPGFDPSSGWGIVNIPNALAAPAPQRDPDEPNDDVDQVKPGSLFPAGEPPLTTAARPSNRIAATLDASEDPGDLYRIWVPAHRVVRVSVSAGGNAAARIWGPLTSSVDESLAARRRDLKGQLVRAAGKGFAAYVEVLLTGRSDETQYVLSVKSSTR
jgi:subtilisin family serine protease